MLNSQSEENFPKYIEFLDVFVFDFWGWVGRPCAVWLYLVMSCSGIRGCVNLISVFSLLAFGFGLSSFSIFCIYFLHRRLREFSLLIFVQMSFNDYKLHFDHTLERTYSWAYRLWGFWILVCRKRGQKREPCYVAHSTTLQIALALCNKLVYKIYKVWDMPLFVFVWLALLSMTKTFTLQWKFNKGVVLCTKGRVEKGLNVE